MKALIRYVFKRLLLLIPVIIAVSIIVFTLMELAPGTIIDVLITEAMTEEDIAALERMYNLDRSMLYRYGLYMLNLIRGDLGVSDITGLDVMETYLTRLPNTLLLSLGALIVGTSISVPVGIFAARRAGKLADNVTTTFTLLGISVPSFWLGVLLLIVFSFWLGWLPAGGNRDGIRSLILPSICSGLLLMATTARQTRSSMLEVLKADYLRTARAKGVPEETVIRKHALGNAWIPILTTIGTSLSFTLASSVVVEQVFSWPGVGRMTVTAVLGRDVTTTLGCVIMTTILYVILLLIVDLLYAFVDPRIKSQYTAGKSKRKSTVIVRSGRDNIPLDKTASASSPEHQDASPAVAFELGLLDSDKSEVSMAAVLPDNEQSVVAGTASGTHTMLIESDEEPDFTKGRNADAIAATPAAGLATRKHKKRSQMSEIFHNLKRNKGAMAGLVIVGLLFLTFIASLFIKFEAVTATNIMLRLNPPSWQFPFGNDNLGRDMLLRTVYGTRYSIVIAFGGAGIAAFFGIILGSVAGYYSGLVDDIIMRFSDIIASIPGILLGMVIVVMLGQSLQNLVIAVGVTAIPVFLRITRATILTVRNQEFVEAARAVGLSNFRIIFTQVLPNGLSPIIVIFTISLGMSIIVASSLSFLGFGVPMPTPEWGALISGARDFVRPAPHLMIFPGLFIMLTVLAFNLLGDGLRDALDPKLKK